MELNNIQGRKSARILIYKASKYHFNVIDYDMFLRTLEENDGFVPQEVIDATSQMKLYEMDIELYQIENSSSSYVITSFDGDKTVKANTLEESIEKVQEILRSEYNCKVYFKVLLSGMKNNMTFKI